MRERALLDSAPFLLSPLLTLAGVALAFAIATWADAAGMPEKLLGFATGFGLENTDGLSAVVLAMLGAGIGVSGWLAAQD